MTEEMTRVSVQWGLILLSFTAGHVYLFLDAFIMLHRGLLEVQRNKVTASSIGVVRL